jgi:ATP-dependent DNA helicase RecG
MNLSDSVKIIPRVGPKVFTRLCSLGIKSIRDLIYYYPRNWIDLTNVLNVADLQIDQIGALKGKIIDIENTKIYRRKMVITKALLQDNTGQNIQAVWFNQSYLQHYFRKGSFWIFYGKVEYDFSKKIKSFSNPIYTQNPRIISVYSQTEGINSKFISKILNFVLAKVKIKDFLPKEIIKKESLIDLAKALYSIHFPKTNHDIVVARQRLAFDELFLLSLKMLRRKRIYKSQNSYPCKIFQKKIDKLEQRLPFCLTGCQKKVVSEILADTSQNRPMTRLVNGDVGSGKTVVALLATYNMYLNSKKTVWMVPTEILAKQHFETMRKYLKNKNIKIGLLTSNIILYVDKKSRIVSKCTKDQVLNCDVIVGTHSVIQKDVRIGNLGLIVIDEEHRFGVKQRTHLIAQHLSSKKDFPNNDKGKSSVNYSLSKSQSVKTIPHFLSMTATPIPRTMAISIYADMDISIIDKLPSGRKPIATKIVSPSNRQKAYDFIKLHIKNNRQAFVICPLIDEGVNADLSKKGELFLLDRKTVKNEYLKLSQHIFPGLKIQMLHGKMKSKEKERIMHDFKQGKIDILVSTSVVEVGVDVPNANLMIVEDADRFGLAQLHQFRGRVGRGTHQSFCFLFTGSISTDAQKRLQAMEKHRDGFKLAQIDLVTRGPGEIIGDKQSGYNQLKIASLSDMITLKKAQSSAKYVLDRGIDKVIIDRKF